MKYYNHCNKSDEEAKGLLWKLWRWLDVGLGSALTLEVINHVFFLFFFLA
jgi:hypothetical protein